MTDALGFLVESVHTCPLCLAWSVIYRGYVNHSDLEDVLRDHLDAEHKGWTMDVLRAVTPQTTPEEG